MQEQMFAAIEEAVSKGVPTTLLADALVRNGWPEEMVREAVQSWVTQHGKGTKPATSFKQWLKKYYRKALPAVGVVVVLNVIDAGIALLKPWPVKIMADSAFGDIPAPAIITKITGQDLTGTPKLILVTSAMTLMLFIFGAIFGTFRDYFLLKIGFWLNRSIKEESFRHILHIPLFHQERLAKGDYIYRQNVVTNSLSDLVLGTTSEILESIIMIIGVLIIMTFFNPMLTLFTIVLIPLLFITMKIIGPHMGQYAQKLTETASATSASISESVDNAETIQAFTLEEKQLSKVNRLWMRSFYYAKKSMLWGKLLGNTNGLLVVTTTAAVMYYGGSAAMKGEMTFGELLIFMTYMGYLLDPVENLVTQVTTRYQKIIDVNRIYEVLTDHEGVEDLRKDNHMPAKITGNIEFKNVSYAYEDQQIFQNLNLTIPAGQKMAVIGPSGGGKSTILKLLPLFLEPDSGQVLIDGIDSQSVSLKELRQKIAWVSQTPQLFGGTIIDNLVDGDAARHISNEEIRDAVVVSNVAEFAVRLPMGFLSPVGENGGSLSGGQRQRVSIARALVKNAPIICLDEPTAALDTKSENYIRDSLEQMIQGKTVVMVTHRRPLLALMDVVYVLEDGQLRDVNELGGLDAYLAHLEGIEQEHVEAEIEADHKELLANQEQFADIHQMDMRSEEDIDDSVGGDDDNQNPPQSNPTVEVGQAEVKEDGEVVVRLR